MFGTRGPNHPLCKGKRTFKNGYAYVFDPAHPMARPGGRYLEHRIVVENSPLFDDPRWFVEYKGRRVLKLEYDVHHKNGITTDNRPENLEVLSWGEHTKEHNLQHKIIRNKTNGRILGVVKSRELLEHPETGNQQPSTVGDDREGSETRDRDLRVSNVPTSAGLVSLTRDDIVRAARITKEKRRRRTQE